MKGLQSLGALEAGFVVVGLFTFGVIASFVLWLCGVGRKR